MTYRIEAGAGSFRPWPPSPWEVLHSKMIRMTKLEAQDVSVHFGGVRALEDVSLEIKARELVGLIGPNGAGKTTLVNVLSGFQRPTSGAAYLDGHDMTRKSPREFAKSGIARTFQAGRLFQELSVRENVQASAVGIGLGLASARKEADALLERLGLRGSASLKALILPFGLQWFERNDWRGGDFLLFFFLFLFFVLLFWNCSSENGLSAGFLFDLWRRLFGFS